MGKWEFEFRLYQGLRWKGLACLASKNLGLGFGVVIAM